jgi:hypothetical protein
MAFAGLHQLLRAVRTSLSAQVEDAQHGWDTAITPLFTGDEGVAFRVSRHASPATSVSLSPTGWSTHTAPPKTFVEFAGAV